MSDCGTPNANLLPWAQPRTGEYLTAGLGEGLLEGLPAFIAHDDPYVPVYCTPDSAQPLTDLARRHGVTLASTARTIARIPAASPDDIAVQLICRATRTLDLHNTAAKVLLEWDSALRGSQPHRNLTQAALDAGIRVADLDPQAGLAGLVDATSTRSPAGSALTWALDTAETVALGIRTQTINEYQNGVFGERVNVGAEAELYGRLLGDRSGNHVTYISVNSASLTDIVFAALDNPDLIGIVRAETRLHERTSGSGRVNVTGRTDTSSGPGHDR
jgi:hypothetical protein